MATLREKLRAKGELLLAHQPIIILGCTVGTFLSLATLATATVLSTASQISSTVESTSEESIFTNYESLEVEVGELKVRATGKSTTDLLQSLLESVVQLEVTPSSDEKSYLYTIPKAPRTLKKPSNSFSTMF